MQCIEIPVPTGLPRERYHDWFLRVVDILRKKYGEENFIDTDIHYDEEHTYRDPETKELVISRVHLHFMFIPEVDGKLNAKEISLRKNMKILNKEVDEMTKSKFGCSFMTGTKGKSYKKVEELKQESENAELLYQMEQEQKEIIARQATLDAREAVLNAKEEELIETQNTLSEWRDNLEQREISVEDLEEQKKAVLHERETIRQKELQLDEAVKAVSEMPPMDENLEKLLDVAFVRYRSSPESAETFDFVARRYLEHLQESQEERAKQICKTVRRTVPDYTFDTPQPTENEMEF